MRPKKNNINLGTDGYPEGSKKIILCQSQHQSKLENFGGNHGKIKSNGIDRGGGTTQLWTRAEGNEGLRGGKKVSKCTVMNFKI